MNRHIKDKKDDKLDYKRTYSKQDQLFLKKYPRLYMVCCRIGITISQINKAYKKLIKINVGKNEIESAIHLIVVAEESNWVFKKGSIGNYYKELFKVLDIKF